jgi:monoamine oxidase
MGGGGSPQVVIVGAGAAGLAAARELAQQDLRVLVLEARPRLFGRVDTLRDPAWPQPIERGAEFLHGETPLTNALARRSGVPLEVVPEAHYWVEHGHARRTPDMEAAVQRLLARESPDRDRPLAAVLAEAPRSRRPSAEVARFYVEGYHAADIDTIGAASLVEPGSDSDASREQRRSPAGYDRILEALPGDLPPDLVEMRLSTVVSEVRWRRGHVRVACGAADDLVFENIDARACIVTVPLGVLRAGTLRFDPEPDGWADALPHLEMGTVEKLVLLFRDAFWNDPALWRRLARRATAPAFSHARGVPFPTFWTSAPRSGLPVLTAWAGGPAARTLTGAGADVLLARAIESLAAMFDVPRMEIADRVVAAHHHDWQADPFSCGAYSYLGVGGRAAQRRLSDAVEGTLVLAGEALAKGSGTVEGALTSGKSAARRLLRDWSRRPGRGSSGARRSTRSGGRRSGTSPRR